MLFAQPGAPFPLLSAFDDPTLNGGPAQRPLHPPGDFPSTMVAPNTGWAGGRGKKEGG